MNIIEKLKKDIRTANEKIRKQKAKITGLTLDFLCEKQTVERETMTQEDARSAQFRAEMKFSELKKQAELWYHSHTNNSQLMEQMQTELDKKQAELDKRND